MDALLLALILTLILDQGSGTQRVVARFGSRVAEEAGPPMATIIGLALVTTINAIVAATLGALVAALLQPDARLLFLSMALAMGGAGLLVVAFRPSPAETPKPLTGIRTLCHFAIRRAGENAAFAIAGVAAFTDAPILTAGGAMLGGWVALISPLTVGTSAVHHAAMRSVQGIGGLVILCAGIACAASALHLL